MLTRILFATLCALGVTFAKPNIIYFNVDDLGVMDVGFNSVRYRTPNVDQLRAEGMLFTQAYAPAANCAPSRACVMSGQYSPRHGVYTVGSSERGKSKDRKLIPIKNTLLLALGKNLAKTHPEKATELHKILKEWRAKTNAPAPTKQNPDFKPTSN